jgi:hypothetical protein
MGMNQLNQSLSVSVPLSLCSVADSFHDFSAGTQKYFIACRKTFTNNKERKMWEDLFNSLLFHEQKNAQQMWKFYRRPNG